MLGHQPALPFDVPLMVFVSLFIRCHQYGHVPWIGQKSTMRDRRARMWWSSTHSHTGLSACVCSELSCVQKNKMKNNQFDGIRCFVTSKLWMRMNNKCYTNFAFPNWFMQHTYTPNTEHTERHSYLNFVCAFDSVCATVVVVLQRLLRQDNYETV